jgi:adenylate kinase family enzyme
MGDELRKSYNAESEVGKKIRNGDMVSNAVIKTVLDKYVDEKIILDGFPRTVEQLELIDLKQAKVIILTADKQTLLRRMHMRKICYICGMEQHTDCTGTMVRRPDDTIEIYDKRFNVYMQYIDQIQAALRNYTIINTTDLTSSEVVQKALHYLQLA